MFSPCDDSEHSGSRQEWLLFLLCSDHDVGYCADAVFTTELLPERLRPMTGQCVYVLCVLSLNVRKQMCSLEGVEDSLTRTMLHDAVNDRIWLVMGTPFTDQTHSERLYFYLLVLIEHTLSVQIPRGQCPG